MGIGEFTVGLQRTGKLDFIYTNPKDPNEIWLKVTDHGLNHTQTGELAYEMDVWFIKWGYSITKIYQTEELHRKAFRYGEKVFALDGLSKYRVLQLLERWVTNKGHSKRSCICPLCVDERKRIADEKADKARLKALKAQQELERGMTPDDFAKLLIPKLNVQESTLQNLNINKTESLVMLSKDDPIFRVDWDEIEPIGQRYDF